MASIEGFGEGFRGKLEGFSFYKMRGTNKVVVRKAGGHTKEKIKKDPKLDKFRRAESEFGGRAKAAKYLMHAMIFHKPLADYNIAGPLTALLKPIQESDATSDYGERGVRLTTHAHYLRGFSLNKNHTLDSVVTHPVTCVIDRGSLAATVYFPELIPLINFNPPVDHPYYSFTVALAVVPDIVRGSHQYEPTHEDYPVQCAVYTSTAWFPLLERADPVEVAIKHDFQPPNEHFTLVLTVGIRYGILKGTDLIEQAPYVGSAKVLEVG